MLIDISYDFTADTPHYWDNFWSNNKGLGGSNFDPDLLSPTLRKYHQILWSRPLPNGQFFSLSQGKGADYLIWNNSRFGSDSIIASFRYQKYRWMMEQLKMDLPDFYGFMESFLHKSYTIGGSIIFPKRRNGINPARGCNPYIKDRWDLTLECIRRFYNNEESPLFAILSKDKEFFDLFVDFKGYVDFFFLQDCVSEDYHSVTFWTDTELFSKDPLPPTTQQYLEWIENELQFVEKRNAGIHNYINK